MPQVMVSSGRNSFVVVVVVDCRAAAVRQNPKRTKGQTGRKGGRKEGRRKSSNDPTIDRHFFWHVAIHSVSTVSQPTSLCSNSSFDLGNTKIFIIEMVSTIAIGPDGWRNDRPQRVVAQREALHRPTFRQAIASFMI
jgi:hypothetical protein